VWQAAAAALSAAASRHACRWTWQLCLPVLLLQGQTVLVLAVRASALGEPPTQGLHQQCRLMHAKR
jgi:hypothetical protein